MTTCNEIEPCLNCAMQSGSCLNNMNNINRVNAALSRSIATKDVRITELHCAILEFDLKLKARINTLRHVGDVPDIALTLGEIQGLDWAYSLWVKEVASLMEQSCTPP